MMTRARFYNFIIFMMILRGTHGSDCGMAP